MHKLQVVIDAMCEDGAAHVALIDAAQLALDEIEQWQQRTSKLRDALLEALEWNWCDEDYPENLYLEFSALCHEAKDSLPTKDKNT